MNLVEKVLLRRGNRSMGGARYWWKGGRSSFSWEGGSQWFSREGRNRGFSWEGRNQGFSCQDHQHATRDSIFINFVVKQDI